MFVPLPDQTICCRYVVFSKTDTNPFRFLETVKSKSHNWKNESHPTKSERTPTRGMALESTIHARGWRHRAEIALRPTIWSRGKECFKKVVQDVCSLYVPGNVIY